MPESIGSKRRVLPVGVVCDKCNNYFARKVEQPILSHSWMRNVRAWQQVPNKKGTYRAVCPVPNRSTCVGQSGIQRIDDDQVASFDTRQVRFDAVQKVVLAMLPTGFPIADPEHRLPYSQLLFLIRRNELHKSRAVYRCMFTRPCTNDINSRLSGKSHLSKSIFEKFGFREQDGRPISATTHQIRHYLNTLAQLGGLSQLDIALWSGRSKVAENNVYDHVSGRDVLAMVRAAVGDPGQTKGPLARLSGVELLERGEFARLKVPTAHTTDLGYCIHDYSMLPCQAHQNCLNCDEHVCVKGDHEKEERLNDLIRETKQLLAKAEADQSLQFAGAHRWVEAQTRTLARAEELKRIMDDPLVPAGAVISIGKTGMPSRLTQAFHDRQKLNGPSLAMPSVKAGRRRRP